MAMDHVKQLEIKRAAEELLQARYGREGRGPLSAEDALTAVLTDLSGHVPPGQDPREVPAEDVLAALAHVDEARQHLDTRELRLIKAARERGASWQRVADSLGLEKRQSAEGRALRLEGAARSHHGRDVGSQRLDKARRRATDAWCDEQADHIRDVCERLVGNSDAWKKVIDSDPMAQSYFHELGARFAADAAANVLYAVMARLRYTLTPHDKKAPVPTGKQADAAMRARIHMVELIAEHDNVRRNVRSVRGGA